MDDTLVFPFGFNRRAYNAVLSVKDDSHSGCVQWMFENESNAFAYNFEFLHYSAKSQHYNQQHTCI